MLAASRVPTQRPFVAAPRPAVGRAAAVRVVCKGVATPTKAVDFRSLKDEEILTKIGELKKELASVRFIQRTRGIEEMKPGTEQPQPDPEKTPKGHLNHWYRRQVAQLWTVLRERSLAQGVDKRAWRKVTKVLDV